MSTEQNPAPETEPETSPETSPAPGSDSKPEQVKGSGRFAVYDTVELRFRGGVHDSKGKASDAKPEKRKGDPRNRYEVREV
jgi:hypothetical protein